MSLLYNRALLLAKIESVFRTDVNPDETNDAVLVEDPVFGVDATILDRNNVRVHLSQDPGSPGRKIATVSFSHEVRHNGNTDGTVAGKLGVLLRGCGMAETAIDADAETILGDRLIPVNDAAGIITFVGADGYDGALPRVLELHCTTGGPSGTAQFEVDAPAVGNQAAIDLAPAVMTNAMPFTIGEVADGSPTITPTFGATNPAMGDRYIINMSPMGFFYEPVSSGFESLTIYVYYDGLLHTMTGCRGTFTVEGEAGNFARFNFTFTGDFVLPTDTALPASPVYETTIPPQVELSNLVAAGGENDVEYGLCAQSFSIDIANNVVARECINDEDSLAGAIITGRAPTASFNPETELEATHPFWANLNTAARVSFSVRVGVTQGNCVTFWAPYAQYSTLAYGNRNDIRIYDINLRLNTDTNAGGAGNDELRITFS